MLPATIGGTGRRAQEVMIGGGFPGILVLNVQPGVTPPGDEVPTAWPAPGCTAEACAFNNWRDQFAMFDADVFAVSSKSLETLERFRTLKNVAMQFLSDADFELERELGLDTFVHQGVHYYKRIVLVIVNGVVRGTIQNSYAPEVNAELTLAMVTRFSVIRAAQ